MTERPVTAPEETTRNQFGTFGGVFTPSILTILGVIMFMRTGFVTAEAGILNTVVILLFSKAITFLTGLSISAISTNTEVKGGGAYFLISRSLGPEFGGAIGMTLYLAQAFSVPFYILGFAEALLISSKGTSWHDPIEHNLMWIGMGTAALLFVINVVGAGWAIKAQYFILTVLGLSVLVFLGGAALEFEPSVFEANLSSAYTEPGYDFWVMFAIFFPAVTGIMAGVNMSGDLKEPARSIPKGTLLAIGTGFLIYLLQILVTGGSTPRLSLMQDPYGSLLDQALLGLEFVVVGGVFAATLSSALGSFMGAPRILQALARDHIFPVLRPFGKGSDKGDEPRRGLLLTLLLTLGVLFAAGNDTEGGALNVVASVLSMFFLYTYGMTNLAAFIESFSKNPSFRPRFRQFHWVTALLGTLGCFAATLLIDPTAAIISMLILVGLYVYVERRVLTTTFGDARRGFYYSRARDNIFKLAEQPPHAKNWRPTTLVLTGNPHTRSTLAQYAVWLESGRGLTTLAEVLVGDVHVLLERRREALERLKAYIKERNLRAFAEVMVAPSFDQGTAALIQVHSLGPLKPNVVMLGWPGEGGRIRPFVQTMRLAGELGMSQIVLVEREGRARAGGPQRIDVWWRGHENGSLMVILAYMLTLTFEWSGARIRLLRMVPDEASRQAAHTELHGLAEAARVEADIHVVVGESFAEILATSSGSADVVFLGFSIPDEEGAEAFHDTFTRLLAGLPTTLLVCSSGEADLLA